MRGRHSGGDRCSSAVMRTDGRAARQIDKKPAEAAGIRRGRVTGDWAGDFSRRRYRRPLMAGGSLCPAVDH